MGRLTVVSRDNAANGVAGAATRLDWRKGMQLVGEDLDADRRTRSDLGEHPHQSRQVELTVAGKPPIVQGGGDQVGLG